MPRGTFNDLTGQRFVKLVALDYDKATKKWYCRCDCGTIKQVDANSLRRDKTRSCGGKGCREANLKLNLIGHVYTKLKVISEAQPNKHGHICWFVQCECGSLPFAVEAGSLRSGNTQSCGCLLAESAIQRGLEARKNSQVLTGQTWGMLTYVKDLYRRPGGKRRVELLCACGNTTFSTLENLTQGYKKSCGCYRDYLEYKGGFKKGVFIPTSRNGGKP